MRRHTIKIAALMGALVLISPPPAHAQFFNPVPEQAGPNAPRETPDYPVPTVTTPQGAMPAVPMPPPPPSGPFPSVQYPAAPPQPRQGMAIQVLPAPAATPAPGPAAMAPATPRSTVAASQPASQAPPAQARPAPSPSSQASAGQTAGQTSAGQTSAGQTSAGQTQAGQTQASLSPNGQAPAASNQPDPWQPRGGAELRALDKVNARSLTLSGRVGQVIRYATLTIVVRACVVRAPDQEADAAAFLDITDSRPNTPSFHGWMLQDEPGLMVYEHPVYDVRILGCRA